MTRDDDPKTSPSATRASSAVLAIVPALDEAGSIGAVVRAARSLASPPEIVVVDDGSEDDTAAIARRAGAAVLRMPFNCGIGASVQAGILLGLERGYQRFARMDGDGQHDPRALVEMLAIIERGDADFVLGSRYLVRGSFQSTQLRRMGSRWFAILLRLVSGIRISDPTSGLWVANRRAAEVLFSQHSPDYPEVDSLVSLVRAGCVIAEHPVAMSARTAGRSSIRPLDALYYVLKVTVALLMSRVREAPFEGAGETRWNSKPTKQSPS